MIRADWTESTDRRVFRVRCEGCGAEMAAYTVGTSAQEKHDTQERAWWAFTQETTRSGCPGCSTKGAWRRARATFASPRPRARHAAP